MEATIAILFLINVVGYAGLFYLMLTRRDRKEQTFDIGLKEIKETIDIVNKLAKNNNQLESVFESYNSCLKRLAINQRVFTAEIKQLKVAVVALQNIEIDSRVEGE